MVALPLDGTLLLQTLHPPQLQDDAAEPQCGASAPTTDPAAASLPEEEEEEEEDAPQEAKRKPAIFFGICDLKYDRWKPAGDCVKVLELGDGGTSQFSGSGAHVLEAFERSFYLSRPINRATLVNHKRMTHDAFRACGCGALRPRQCCFQRQYSPSLAASILRKLGLPHEDGEVVLKLCNNYRGAGVVVARGTVDLDQRLKTLLIPDHSVLRERSLEDAIDSDPESMREQCLHWWSNECPVFVAEQCLTMEHGITADGSDGRGAVEAYDATMRVGFVLRRSPASKDQLCVAEFLGAYWKLPRQPRYSQDLRARCVSRASKGTADVDPEDSSRVYDALRDALPKVFAPSMARAFFITKQYHTDPLLCGFTLARYAAEQVKREIKERGKAQAAGREFRTRQSRVAQTNQLFALAQEKLDSYIVPDLAHVAAAASYIKRQLGVAETRQDWEKAARYWQSALVKHPLNASAQYLVGVYHLRKEQPDDYARAKEYFLRSVQLDPDFKAVYANLGVVSLALRDWDGAAKTSRRGLERFPKAYQCSYNLGVACGHRLVALLDQEEEAKALGDEWRGRGCLEEAAAIAAEAAAQLQLARGQGKRTDWSQGDDVLLELLVALAAEFAVVAAAGAAGRAGAARTSLASATVADDWWADPRRKLGEALEGTKGWSIVNFRP